MRSKEEIKIQRAEHRLKNRDRINAQKRKYHAENKEAIRTTDKLRYEGRKEEVKARVKARVAGIKEYIKEYNRLYRIRNYEKKQAYDKAYNIANKEVIAEQRSIYRQHNRDKFNAWHMKRHCAKLQRTPPWLTAIHLEEIRQVYETAAQLSKETGIQHHVDHIVPLQGKTVSGLHVPWNLRAITTHENISKINKLLEL